MAGYAVGQAFVIVWRESLEAIFIISILHACLKRSEPRALPAIWAGAAIGICFSLALALAMVSAQDALSGTTLVFFEAATLLASSILMTQMVFWMRKHARALRAKIESSLGGAASRSRAWSVAIIAALAVGREGAEAVIYVYSLAVERGRSALPLMASEVALGLFAALATAWIASKGIRFLKNGLFFEITGFVLLLSAASLGASAVGRLVQENILPGLIEPAWDMSRWISPSSALMAAFKLIAGYNPRPSLLEVLAYAFYWFLVGASYRFFQFRSLMGKLPFLSALRGANGE